MTGWKIFAPPTIDEAETESEPAPTEEADKTMDMRDFCRAVGRYEIPGEERNKHA